MSGWISPAAEQVVHVLGVILEVQAVAGLIDKLLERDDLRVIRRNR